MITHEEESTIGMTTNGSEPDVAEVYPPNAEFAATANAGPELYAAAAADRLAFWADQAQRLHWHQKWTEVLDWSDAPVAKWFTGGELNVAYNCVDRHVFAGNGDRVAIHFEGSRATAATSPTATCSPKSAGRQTLSPISASSPGTAWPSTCR